MERENSVFDIRTIFSVLRKNLILLIASTLLVATGAYLVTEYLMEPRYDVAATLIVNSKDEDLFNPGVANAADYTTAAQMVKMYTIVLINDSLMQEIKDELGLSDSIESLKNRIIAEPVNSTPIMRVSIRATNPEKSKLILDKLVEKAPDALIKNLKAGSVEILSPPRINYSPVSPDKRSNTFVGAMAGLLFALLVVFIKKSLENTFISSEDVVKHLNLPVLGVLPKIKKQEK